MSTPSSEVRHYSNRGFSLVEVLIMITVAAIVTAMAIPAFSSIVRALRGEGDLRAISSAVSLAKMRAAASGSKARLRADLSARTIRVEVWNQTTNTWDPEDVSHTLSDDVNFGFDTITTPPPNTQAAIGQAPACKDSANADIADTACIVFNSRGVPVDSTGSPYGDGALYVTDGAAAQGVTVRATGLILSWRRDLAAGSTWQGR